MSKESSRAIILMGVSGCGKTAVGVRLSQALNWPFIEGDDFHSAENIAKMSQGLPLNDDDRAPWLAKLQNLIADHLQAGKSIILACSALKKKYRDQLEEGNSGTLFVYLKGDFNLILERISNREDHYMKAEMLRSQFEALEEPSDAFTINVDRSLEEIVEGIILYLKAGKQI